jgi:hydroxyacylglutathione hydrolase
MNSRVHTLKVSHGSLKNYNYLIVDNTSHNSVLVDPAWELATLEKALTEQQSVLTGILVTHSHPDHINLADTLAKRWQVPVFMSQIEIDYYRYHCVNLVPLQQEKPFNCGTLTIMPHFTPGHTKGSICYQIDSALFTGDTLFTEGCGICLGPGADPYQMFTSLQKLKARLDTTTRIFPGHSFGKPVGQTFAYLLANNFYLQFDQADQFVAFRMRKRQDKARWFDFK